jgi:hypothetical protein
MTGLEIPFRKIGRFYGEKALALNLFRVESSREWRVIQEISFIMSFKRFSLSLHSNSEERTWVGFGIKKVY